MTDSLRASDPLANEAPHAARADLRLFRRVAYPLVVIALIVVAIWWLENRANVGVSPTTGERYGPAALPSALLPAGQDVSAKEGALAPDFLLERLDGGEMRLSDFRGQPVVLNFWATWCAPCRKEIPQLVKAYSRHKDEGLAIVGLNLQEGKSVVGPFAQDFGMNFPIAIDRDGEVGDEYRLLGLPTTFFIDRDGAIRSVFTGPLLEKAGDTNVQGAIGESELENRIAAILAPSPSEAAR